nr:meiotically up-regulated gene 157 protein [Quercus suber]
MALTVLLLAFTSLAIGACPDYLDYASQHHGPYSQGRYNLSYQRPDPACRTFNSSIVENTIDHVVQDISDPDLRRLFINTYPNTLDTAIRWKGHAQGSDEELTFVITGDINAMWLRDSANQMQSYLPLLKASNSADSLASLYRGVINLQARYILYNPYCNSHQPPAESGVDPSPNSSADDDVVVPPYSNTSVFECKYELDSVAAFLEVSTNYYAATKDVKFFSKYSWVQAVEAILQLADDMMVPTYQADGNVSTLAYSFTRDTTRASETTENDGKGNPFKNGTGLIRSFFRPSDDATIYQGFIPANMMFSRYLASSADIMAKIGGRDALAIRMRKLAAGVRAAITKHGIVHTSTHGNIYAFEVDGYFGQNIMDDANIPSLLAAPFFGYLDVDDAVYQNTRKLLLSTDNPYYMTGPVLSAIGGPHDGPGYAWPMAQIVRIFTTDDDHEIAGQLQSIGNKDCRGAKEPFSGENAFEKYAQSDSKIILTELISRLTLYKRYSSIVEPNPNTAKTGRTASDVRPHFRLQVRLPVVTSFLRDRPTQLRHYLPFATTIETLSLSSANAANDKGLRPRMKFHQPRRWPCGITAF